MVQICSIACMFPVVDMWWYWSEAAIPTPRVETVSGTARDWGCWAILSNASYIADPWAYLLRNASCRSFCIFWPTFSRHCSSFFLRDPRPLRELLFDFLSPSLEMVVLGKSVLDSIVWNTGENSMKHTEYSKDLNIKSIYELSIKNMIGTMCLNKNIEIIFFI